MAYTTCNAKKHHHEALENACVMQKNFPAYGVIAILMLFSFAQDYVFSAAKTYD